MTLHEILEKIPEVAKIVGGWATGMLTFFVSFRAYQNKRRITRTTLIKEYKALYIKQSVELLRVSESESTKRRILIEIKSFCPDCYDQCIDNLGDDFKNHKI